MSLESLFPSPPPRRGAVLAISADTASCRGAVADLAGDVLARDRRPAKAADPSKAVLTCLRRLRHAATAAELPVEAVVLAIPARLDPDSGLTVSVVDDRWDGLDLRDILAEHAVEPVLVENDVRLAALAQAWRGQVPAGEDFVTVSLGRRVESAIVTNGRLVRGRSHAAGEIGGALKLDAVVAEAVMARDGALSGPLLGELLDRLSAAIAVLVGVVDPGTVILDGSVGRSLEAHLGALRERLAGRVRAAPELCVSRLSDDAPLLGAIAAGLELVRAGEASAGVWLAPPPRGTLAADGGLEGSRLPIDVRDRVMDAFDAGHALELLRVVVGVPSPVGDELFLAGVVAGELHALGFEQVAFDRIGGSRATTSGTLRGSGGGGGGALLLAAHLETGGAEGWAERWGADARADPFAGAIVDGALWGRGTAASKSGLAAALAALWMLARAGLKPRGDVILAAIADRQPDGPGVPLSRGMRTLVERLRHGELTRPDFAIYLEPTGLAVQPTQAGRLAMRLSVRPRDGAADPRGAAQVIGVALNGHARELGRGTTHPLLGPAALEVGELEDRGVYGVSIPLTRSVLPGETLDDAAAAIEAVVAEAGGPRVETQVTYVEERDHALGGRPFEVSPEEPGVARLRTAIRSVRADGGRIRGATSWSELSFLTELGVPGAYFSAGEAAHRDSPEERVAVEDFLDAVRALALFIAEQCLTEPAPPRSGHADAEDA